MILKIYVKEIEVPSKAMCQVATILAAHKLRNLITQFDESNDTITLEVYYDMESKKFVQKIVDLLKSYDHAIGKGEP